MNDSKVFAKLNLKNQEQILILNSPPSFEAEIAKLVDVSISRQLPRDGVVAFALVFVTGKAEVDLLSKELTRLAEGDAIIWFAYPKGTSKRYKCDFNRDTGWDILGELGFEGVRMVAIDEDWSALRFRRVEYIKALGSRR